MSSSKRQERSTEYLTGLRGIAALFVYNFHLVYPFTQKSIEPFHSWSESSLLQLPVIRLFYCGSAMVALFFALSGFVLSIKPVQLTKQERWSELSASISSSIFRRGWRLYLPCVPATFMIMLATYFRLYDHNVPDKLFATGVPVELDTLAEQLWDWMMFCFWSLMDIFSISAPYPKSIYGAHLWTIPREFRSSMILYLSFLGLGRMRDGAFMVSVLLIGTFCYMHGLWDVSTFLVGWVLAKYADSPMLLSLGKRSRKWSTSIILVLGIYLTSLPTDQDGHHQEGHFGLVGSRLTMVIGVSLVLASIVHNDTIQDFLSMSPIRWLGDISFSLYIIHFPIHHIIGWRMVTWFSTKADGSLVVGILATWILLTPVVCVLAWMYTLLVDRNAIYFARWLEGMSFSQDGEKGYQQLQQEV